MALLDKAAIIAALRDAQGKVGVAARKLGVARRTLQDRMRLYGMPRGTPGRRRRLIVYGGSRRALALGTIGVAVVGGLALLSRRKNA